MKTEIREFYRLGTKAIQENVTVAGVYNSDTGNLTMHFSRCASCDTYDKDLGKKMALGRAQKNPLMTLPVSVEDAGKTFRIAAEKFLQDRTFVGIATKPEEINRREVVAAHEAFVDSLEKQWATNVTEATGGK